MFVKEKIRRLQNPVRRNEKYKKRVYTLLWKESSNKIENSEAERLYGERQPHGLSKRLSMNELKDIYRNIAAQI